MGRQMNLRNLLVLKKEKKLAKSGKYQVVNIKIKRDKLIKTMEIKLTIKIVIFINMEIKLMNKGKALGQMLEIYHRKILKKKIRNNS